MMDIDLNNIDIPEPIIEGTASSENDRETIKRRLSQIEDDSSEAAEKERKFLFAKLHA